MTKLKTFIFALTFILQDCIENPILNDIEMMRKSPVTIPYSEFVSFENTDSGLDSDYRFIIYIDSTDCSTCSLKNMYYWENILDSLTKYKSNISVNPIFSPRRTILNRFLNNLQEYNFRFPIYVDTCNAFLRANPHIPSNPLLHSFLLDENDSVILVGNPIRNKKIEELFFKILEERKDKQDKK